MAIETKTGDPTGQIYPCRGESQWTGVKDDEIPPQHYLSVPKDQWGQPAWGRLHIELDRWRDDVKGALESWKQNLWRVGQKVYQSKFDPKTAEEDEYLMTLVGPKPKPSLEQLDALLAERKVKRRRPKAAA
jgi:hypothetical protein